MKNALLFGFGLLALSAVGQNVTLGDKEYEVQRMTDMEIGPGIRHTRYRLPSYPLNINVITVDLTNPYNTIETTVANESAKGTEYLVHAANRQSGPSHRALAGANANFWIVSTQPEEYTYSGITRNASVRNGVIVTESNQHRDQWDGGTMRTGVVSLSTDKTAYIDYCTSTIKASNPKIGTLEVHQSNKGIHTDELCMYNSFYGSSRNFMPIYIDANGKYQHDAGGDATEVILDFATDQKWASNTDVPLKVVEVRKNAGKGTLGNHDLALVGRGTNRTALEQLVPDDIVTISYSWTYNPGSEQEVTPAVEQAIGGNALVMRNGELTKHNNNEKYNSQVYSRTGYGCSADGKTLYIVVIDKASDKIYGRSAGCSTAIMCEFARYLGCYNMANFDAGGSAEMFVNGKIINTTTEPSPRAVANGWLVYSIAPEDAADYNTVARLEFADPEVQIPIYASHTPTIIAYNSYGAVLNYEFTDFTLSCDPELGTTDGNVFTAGGNGKKGILTASYGDVTVSKEIEVLQAELSLRVKPLLIDGTRQYPVEVISKVGETVFDYDPADINWSVEDPTIAQIDANGVLHGLKEGTTSYTCSLGSFTDNTEVTVEIAPAPAMDFNNWAEWTAKGTSGITDVALGEDGTVAYTYGSPRDPFVTLSKDQQLYSLPDALCVEFVTSTPLRSIRADLRHATETRTNAVEVEIENCPVEQTVTIEFPMSLLGDPADMSLYPVSVHSLRFNITANAEAKGAQSIKLNSVYAKYTNYSGVENVAAETAKNTLRLSPNPVGPGETIRINMPEVEKVEIFSISGMLIASYDKAENVKAPMVSGSYVVRASSAQGSSSAIVVVK